MVRQRKMQEEIAEDMISIARSLRHNSLAAKEIITGDNQVGMAGENSTVCVNVCS